MSTALQEEMMRLLDQWCLLGTRFCCAGASCGLPLDVLFEPMLTVACDAANTPIRTPLEVPDPASRELTAEGIQSGPSEHVLFEEDDALVPLTNEEMLAHPRSMEFNVELHELQAAIFSGQYAWDDPYEPPPGYKPVFRPWPKDRKTEPYEL